MSSLTTQESSQTRPSNPINPGHPSSPKKHSDPAIPFPTGGKTDSGFSRGLSSAITDKTSAGVQNASTTSEQRSGAEFSKLGVEREGEERSNGDMGRSVKSASESLMQSVEGSVQERGEGVHSMEG
ncbi:hypothetical protein E8E13_003815 [Curvularia kusanoi]|uniref:Uncharacterized protein n=1 Tax=Curvularia kusanoi TaxID=90978 RepID=A0A9P4TF42_CURKU|nr:hypothetical protein E8E13_003815 [Curvularia kusanoi]